MSLEKYPVSEAHGILPRHKQKILPQFSETCICRDLKKQKVLCHCKYSKKANLKSPVLFGYWRKNVSSARPSL